MAICGGDTVRVEIDGVDAGCHEIPDMYSSGVDYVKKQYSTDSVDILSVIYGPLPEGQYYEIIGGKIYSVMTVMVPGKGATVVKIANYEMDSEDGLIVTPEEAPKDWNTIEAILKNQGYSDSEIQSVRDSVRCLNPAGVMICDPETDTFQGSIVLKNILGEVGFDGSWWDVRPGTGTSCITSDKKPGIVNADGECEEKTTPTDDSSTGDGCQVVTQENADECGFEIDESGNLLDKDRDPDSIDENSIAPFYTNCGGGIFAHPDAQCPDVGGVPDCTLEENKDRPECQDFCSDPANANEPECVDKSFQDYVNEVGEDIANTAKGIYDDFKDVITDCVENPIECIKKIGDKIAEAGIPEKCQDLKDCSVADPEKGTYCWKDCVNFSVLAGIPGLPQLPGMGEIDVGTYRDFEDFLKGIGKDIGDFIEDPAGTLEGWKDAIIQKIKDIFSDVSDTDPSDIIDWLKGIFGVYTATWIWGELEEEITNLLPVTPIDEKCEEIDETNADECGYKKCGDTFIKKSEICENQDNDNCTEGTLDPSSGLCICGPDTANAGMEEDIDGSCDGAEAPDCTGEITEDIAALCGKKKCGDEFIDAELVCEEDTAQTCDNNAINPDACNDCGDGSTPDQHIDGDCNNDRLPDDGPENGTDCPEGQVRRGGLPEGECVKPGVTCFTEPSKYPGDATDILQGQYNSEGFCVSPTGGSQCPEGYDKPDGYDKCVSIVDVLCKDTNVANKYEQCKTEEPPIGEEGDDCTVEIPAFYAASCSDAPMSSVSGTVKDGKCVPTVGQSCQSVLSNCESAPNGVVRTSQYSDSGYACEGTNAPEGDLECTKEDYTGDKAYNAHFGKCMNPCPESNQVRGYNGRCVPIGSECIQQLYGNEVCTGIGTDRGVIAEDGNCVCPEPEVDCSEITETNYKDCNKVKCPPDSEKPYADSLDDCTTKLPPEECRDDQENPTGAIYPDCNKCPEGQDFNKSGICEDIPVVTCQDPNATNYEQKGECGPCKELYDKPDGYDECTLIETLCQEDPQYAEGNELCQGPCADGEVEFVAQNGEIFCDAPCAYNDQIASSSPDCVAPECRNGATDYPDCVTCPSGQRINPETDQCEEIDCTDPANALICGWVKCDDETMAPTLGDCNIQETPCKDPEYAAANPLECGWVECPNGTFAQTRDECTEEPLECENGATDYPDCTVCPEGQSMDAEGNCTDCSDCSCAEYAAANPEKCITEPPVEPPETGGGGSVGGSGGSMFDPFMAGISYTKQAVPEPPAPPQKDYMAELDNLIKRSLFEGMA